VNIEHPWKAQRMNDSSPIDAGQHDGDVNDAEVSAGMAPTPGYRYADRAGDRLFVAGQVPLDSDGVLVGRDDPADQARTCLDNLALLLRVHDFGIGDVRHLTVYVVGEQQHLLDAWAAVTEWFGDSERPGDAVPPATLLGVHLLGHGGQLVEVDATIVRRPVEPSTRPPTEDAP
jgi:enamine deaminase RidA (YjgF/YER057c/UK114 family)